MRYLFFLITFLSLSSCATTSEPVVDYASEDVISFRFDSWEPNYRLPIEVRDKAAKHCKKFNKMAVYKGGKSVGYSLMEQHDFVCELQIIKQVD